MALFRFGGQIVQDSFEESRPDNQRRPQIVPIVVITVVVTVVLCIVIGIIITIPNHNCDLVPVSMREHSTPLGYRIDIVNVNRPEKISSFKVSILKDNVSWFDNPKVLINGNIAIGPAGEYLNFTDLTSDGNLSFGDCFRLENMTLFSEYEIILIWGECDMEITKVCIP